MKYMTLYSYAFPHQDDLEARRIRLILATSPRWLVPEVEIQLYISVIRSADQSFMTLRWMLWALRCYQ
jgi:hypothetical protein